MWKKELGITAKPKKQIDLDDNQIANCKVWYQAGGEPFLNQPFFNIVEKFTQINPDVEMTINSNMSNVSDKWLKLLSKLQNLHIISSIDATGDLLTYLRYPVTEEKITNSIKKLYDQTDATIMAGPVLSNLGIGHLLKTMKYLIEQLKDASMIDIGLVNSPDEFSIKAIPYNIRKDYLDIVYKTKQLCKQSIKSIRVVKILDGLDKIVQNLESLDYDKTLHLKLQNTCTLQDNRRSLKLADVDPYLHSWVYDKYIT
jgi:sulfatase maturation enzyme AslB (radical SAM superfamily)